MLKLGGFTENVDWLKFIAIAAGHLTNVSHTKLVELHRMVSEIKVPVNKNNNKETNTWWLLFQWFVQTCFYI